jgi:hypothetical protein
MGVMSVNSVDITVRAPSNIALVKYMGKSGEEGNLPANSSLSMTLNSLCTVARVRKAKTGGFRWDGALMDGSETVDGLAARVPMLNVKGTERILKHVRRSQWPLRAQKRFKLFGPPGVRNPNSAGHWQRYHVRVQAVLVARWKDLSSSGAERVPNRWREWRCPPWWTSCSWRAVKKKKCRRRKRTGRY